ncbi:MAG: hypothetical protein ACD_50C00032G0008 [uncultured bacterium]|nr:MAG: hypothetical protein ACD_50C00032G0008 [uncultured bacterium]OGH14072.1 MAG: hypothetical protein A2687_02295 [Candidatus Levybacteria bacterium RIFCSPHIGHO2_01_FULL_38_26]
MDSLHVGFPFIIITFFTPFFLGCIIFLRSYKKYVRLYRKKINPDYPLLFGEATNYFSKDPLDYLQKLPIVPLLQWKIIFESHKDQELNELARKTRSSFWVFLAIIFINFLFHAFFLI